MLSAVMPRSCRYFRAGSASGGAEQAVVILPFGPGHGLVEGAFIGRGARAGGRGRRLGRFRPRWLLQGDAGPVGQHRHGLGELDAFGLHDEAEDVAADVADPALERLPLGIDLETGARVVVPGAQSDVVAALAAELDDAADQVDDVDRLADLFLGIERPARMAPSTPVCHEGRIPFRKCLVRPRARVTPSGTNPFVATSCPQEG